ncbi:MAG: YCF48-related protein [Ignavibacteria bacterium]
MKLRILILLIFTTLSICSSVLSQTLQWRLLPNSPTTGSGGRYEDIYFLNSTTGWAIHESGKIYRTTNGGNAWDTSFIAASSPALRSIGFFDYENGILGTLSDDSTRILFRTTNHGVNWSPITNLPSPWPLGICGINILNENVGFAVGRYVMPARIVKTTDKGLTWTAQLIDTSMATSIVDCYFWDENNGIAVGGRSYSITFLGSYPVVLRTTNGGTTWSRVYLGSQFGQFWKISTRTSSLVYLSTESYSFGISNIMKSTDAGYNWTEIPFRNFHQQGIGFMNESTGWVGGFGSTYETTDGGAEWHLAGWGNNLNRIRIINDTIAYAGDNRIYKYSTESVGIKNITTNIPGEYFLYQNYPNPFNPVTKIRFDIISDVSRNESNVRLIVYDALGKEVTTLLSEKLSPGSYEVEFDGNSLSSGIYFYKLQTENFSEVKRMILLR